MRTTIRTGAVATLIAGIVAGAVAVAPTAVADPAPIDTTAAPYLLHRWPSPPPIDTTVAKAVPRGVVTGTRPADEIGARTGGIIAAAPTPAPSPSPFIYPFDGKLKIAGGNYTVDHDVIVVVRHDSGETQWSKRVTARTHPITPGGAVYVGTDIHWCTGNDNGYARAYDVTTKRWSPRVRVNICISIDGTGDFNNHAASD